MAADWVTISALATAGGTLVLAVATFASVRSANRAARVAEQTLLDGLRPQLMASRFNDPPEKVSFVDQHWIRVSGGRGVIEIADDVIYMAIALRNAGRGMAILHGWAVWPDGSSATRPDHHPLNDFRRLTRDLYIPFEGLGFWQGAIRDPADPLFEQIRDSVERREPISVELLYGDTNGGQRAITRLGLMPHDDQEGNHIWLAAVSRHWNLERGEPR
jgi:hypothetical protein